MKPKFAISDNLGFGGHNAALTFKVHGKGERRGPDTLTLMSAKLTQDTATKPALRLAATFPKLLFLLGFRFLGLPSLVKCVFCDYQSLPWLRTAM